VALKGFAIAASTRDPAALECENSDSGLLEAAAGVAFHDIWQQTLWLIAKMRGAIGA
jgi:hypothetical protein